MSNLEKSLVPAKNEQPQIFLFGENRINIRTLMVDNKPHFVGADVAKALGYARPHKAISDHCRYALKVVVPHPQNPDKDLEVLAIPEGDLVRLTIRSKLETARQFESWVMDEVIPTIMRTGKYTAKKRNNVKGDAYLDYTSIPLEAKILNGQKITCISRNGGVWYRIADVARALNVRNKSAAVADMLDDHDFFVKKRLIKGRGGYCWLTNERGYRFLLKHYKDRIWLGNGGSTSPDVKRLATATATATKANNADLTAEDFPTRENGVRAFLDQYGFKRGTVPVPKLEFYMRYCVFVGFKTREQPLSAHELERYLEVCGIFVRITGHGKQSTAHYMLNKTFPKKLKLV